VAELNDLPLRDDLKGQTPYGAPQLNVPIQLNVNENTHKIPESVALDIVESLASAVMTLNRYPDREFLNLLVFWVTVSALTRSGPQMAPTRF
jgi:histidinol-phosphate aminotransferase